MKNVLTFAFRYTIEATSLRENPFYYHVYFVGANTVFGYIIPFVLLVVLNIQIVRTLNAPPSSKDEIPQLCRHVGRSRSVRYVLSLDTNPFNVPHS